MPSKPRKRPVNTPHTLRREVETLLAHKRQNTADMLIQAGHWLVQELQIHQLELEMQHEELDQTQRELKDIHNRYTALYDFAPVGYLYLNSDGVILEANLAAAHMLGMVRSRLPRHRLSGFVVPDAQDVLARYHQRVFAEEMTQTCDLWMKRQDGTRFYAQLKSRTQREEESGSICWHLAVIDMTAKQQLEEELAWTAAIVESSNDAIIGETLDGTIVSWNAAAQRLYGYAPADICGRPGAILAVPEQRDMMPDLLARIQRHERIEHYETQHLSQDGRRIDVSLTLSPISHRDRGCIGVSIMSRDITARKQTEAQLRQAEQALRESQTQLRRLVRHQHEQQEHERTRLARAIHDELAQVTTSMRLDIAWLTERLTAAADVHDRLRALSAQVDDLDRGVHRIGMELRPRLLDDLGLLAAIEWQLQEVQQRAGLAYTLQTPREEMPMHPELATAVFRIFQEALTNVVRHAGASQVDVRVNEVAEGIRLEIVDNGKGITQTQQTHRRALGILGMRERAQLWGGAVTIEGKPDIGTTVTVWMPYHVAEHGEPAHDPSPAGR